MPKKFTILSSLAILALMALGGRCLAESIEQYDKHVIIVVDQTVGKNINREGVYRELCSLLKNERENFVFNPRTDEISLFGFALPGADYNDIMQLRINGANPEYLFDKFASAFIEAEGSFRESKTTLDSFLAEEFFKLFNGDTDICRRWTTSEGSRMTFSHYVYPTILKFIDAKVPSSQFILIVVSDFQSGAYGQGDIMDEFWMNQLMYTQFDEVDSKIKKIGEPFVRVDLMDFRKGDPKQASNNLRPLRVKGYRLLMKKTVQKSPIFITSGISPLKQKGYKGTKYDIQPATVLFNKDDNTEVTKIQLEVYGQGGQPLCSYVVADSTAATEAFNDGQRTYAIKNPAIDLATASPTDLTFDYKFYTISKDDAGNNIMPYVLTASRDIYKSDFEINKGYSTMMISILIALAVLCIIAYFVWAQRGKNREVKLTYHIDPVSKMRYMDVKDDKEEGWLHVLNYDCWYLNPRNGSEGETRINVEGDAELLPKRFAKKYPIRVSYMVEDLDQNDDFTFRPEGQESGLGADKKKDKYYPIESLGNNGHFRFTAIAYIDENKKPEFENRENILEMGVRLKVELIDKSGKHIQTLKETDNEDAPYRFIAKTEIPNSDLWMAFDPGTSGSCVAYGIGGNPDNTDNIHIAKNYEKGKGWESPIIPSYITVTPTDETLRKVEMGKIEEFTANDFEFGNSAYQQANHCNRFQSIKKLLGYSKTKQVLYSENGKEVEVEGRDLAFLIAKGLVGNFEKFIEGNKDGETKDILNKFMQNGEFKPSRAIVAVPNNYTLIKVKEMVDSIKRTGKFAEVHYLYEAEGVLMSYLRKNWTHLQEKEHLTFVVFDMGGATINATAFKIKVNKGISPSGKPYIRDIEVETVSKVGYCVGGDNIDYALMQVLYNIPSLKEALAKQGIDPKKHQGMYKPEILRYIGELKLSVIDAVNSGFNADNMKQGNLFKDMADMAILWTSLTNHFKEWNVNIPDSEGKVPPSFKQHITAELFGEKTILQKGVFDKVQDAVMELMNDNNRIAGSEIELIFSGRSTLYPDIKETVLREIRNEKYNCKCEDRWHGFDKEGTSELDVDKVKTAVVEGACWYAIFSTRIVMKHSLVTSTFGYVDMVNEKSTFVPVVNKNEQFDNNGKRKAEVDVQNPTLSSIKFIQMLGTDYDDIMDNDIRHKMNPLMELTAARLNGTVTKVQIEVDDQSNFNYAVSLAGHSPVTGHYIAPDTDILDENSDEYAFAAIRPKDRPVVVPADTAGGRGRRHGGGLG